MLDSVGKVNSSENCCKVTRNDEKSYQEDSQPSLLAVADVSFLVQQGRELYKTGRFSDAATVWQQAAKLYQDQGDEINLAMVLNYLCLTYQQLGQLSQATEAIANSLNILQTEQDGNEPPERSPILAQALNAQGSLQLAKGQGSQALTTWKRAGAIYAQLGDHQGRIGSLINQAQAQQILGLYLQARKTLTKVEQALQEQPNLQLKTTGLRSLGNVLRLVGDLEDSRKILTKSLDYARQLKSSQDISAILLSLGNTAQAQQQYEEALDYYQQAVTESISSTTKIQAQLNQLSLLIDRKKWSKAQTLPSQIQPQLDHLTPSRGAIYDQINFARSLMQLRQNTSVNTPSWTQIAYVASNAVEQARSLNDQRAEAYALGYLGGLYEQNRQWSTGKQLTQRALLLAQGINASDIAYQWQWQLGRLLKAQGKVSEATIAYEAAFNTLKSIRSDLVAINPDIQFSFRESVEPVYRELVDLLLQTSQDGVSQDNLRKARFVIESLQLAELNDFFRSVCLEGKIVPIEEVDQTGAAVIYPIILADRLEVILSLPGKALRHYGTSISQGEVEKIIEQLQRNLKKPYTAPEGKTLSQQVYDWLIRPVEADLAQSQVKTLVFVLDGVLRNVPMAALYDGQNYLVEKYSIALTPGLQLLEPKPLRERTLEALAAGMTEERHGFSALVNVKGELAQIESEVPSEVLMNQEFTSKALQKQISALPFPVVHLATHGQFSSKAEDTFILAWDKPINVKELDVLLRTSDETRLEAIELLVLSACETAAGDKRAALGLAGVAVQAGARSTLASLWNLDDESGARFVSLFYRELANRRVTKAEALRQAQLSLLKDPNYRHPVHWAPYVLVGNWL
ncbi:MAG: CHAT domain-containing protein [Moorea sp. SIO2B7]|nr:CHAT domain-containing protein [Moorena sp. SIO2B7]